MAKLWENVRFGDGHLTMFWIFLAGLLEGSLVEALLAQAISNKPGRYLDSWMIRNHLHQLCGCYAESILAQSVTPSVSVDKLLNEYQVDLHYVSLSVSDCAAIGTVLQSHPQTERIHKVDFDGCCMQDVGLAQLLPGLQRCKSIKSFNMRVNKLSLSSQHMSAVSGVLANNASTLRNVDLSLNRVGDDGLEKLSKGLQQCRNLQELWLIHIGLTSRSASTLSDVLSSLPSLEKLSISGNNLGDNGIAQLAHGLHFCTRLKLLDITSTALSSESFPVLNRLLLALSSLELKIQYPYFSEEDKKKLLRGVYVGRITFSRH